MKAICLILTFCLVFPISMLCPLNEAQAGEQSDEAKTQIVQMLSDLNDGKDVECERMMRLLLGLEAGEEIDNQQLIRLLLGIRGDSEISNEQILKLLE